MKVTNENQPDAGAAAAKPAAPEALNTLLQEEDQRAADDSALAEEIGADESVEINGRKSAAAKQKAAEAGAAMAVGFVAQVLVMVEPAATLQDEEIDALTGALAPVLAKNNGEPPAWMAEYREEFNLFMVGMGVGVGVYFRVRNAKAEREKEANAKAATTGA